ncbi:MAG: hypothetical protein R3E96_12615 [Planctomycetota bacterium]
MPKSSPAARLLHSLLPLFTGWLLIEAFPGSERLTIPGPDAGGTLPWREALWVLASLFAVIVPAGPMWRNLLLTSLGGALSLVLGNLPIPGLPIFLFAAILTGAGELRVGLRSTHGSGDGLGFLLGLALAWPLAGLAQFTWRMGTGDPGDALVPIVVFVAACALGALAFGRMLPAARTRMAHPIGALLAVGTSLAALRAVETLGTERGLRSMVRRFGLDLSFAGTWRYEALITLSVLILPAFAVGFVLQALVSARARLWVAAGLGAGWLTAPLLRQVDALRELADSTDLGLLAIGWCVAAAVAAIGFIAVGRRILGPLSAAAVIAVLSAYPFQSPAIQKVWSRTPKELLWSKTVAAGQLGVAPEGLLGVSVSLDQWRVTATAEEMRLTELIWRSMALATPARERLLLMGPVTPHDEALLRELGWQAVDRCTAWHATGAEVEQVLHRTETSPFPGDWISAEEARKRASDGRYSLILALPGSRALQPAPDGVLQAQWTRIQDGPAAHRWDCDDVWLVADGLLRFAVGEVWSPPAEVPSLVHRAFPGPPAELDARLAWWEKREWERSAQSLQALFRRLARDTRSENWREAWIALGAFAALQKHSSPFESEAQGTELSPEVAAQLSAALADLPPGPFSEELAGGLARILVGKRDVTGLIAWIAPVSEALGEPYELERSLALAEWEGLDAAAAADRLLRLRAQFPGDKRLLPDLARTLDQSGRPGLSVPIWQELITLHGPEAEFEFALAEAMLRAGDPRLEALRADLANRYPGDERLAPLSQSGPLPAPEVRFQPQEGRHGAHDEHE